MNLSENEEQDKKMKSIQVEEQEQEAGSERKTSFVDLNMDMLYKVLKPLDAMALVQAACVNKSLRMAAYDERLWETLTLKTLASNGEHWSIDERKEWIPTICGFRKYCQIFCRYELKPLPLDFNSMVFKTQSFSESASQSQERQAIYSRNPKSSQDLLLREILRLWKCESEKRTCVRSLSQLCLGLAAENSSISNEALLQGRE